MLKNRRTLLLCSILVTSSLASACGTASETPPVSSTEYSGDDKVFPSDTSLEGVQSFLDSGAYKSAPWVFDAAARPANTSHLPKVRVYFNPEAKKAVSEGKSDSPGAGTMLVKELYDESGTLLGVAASLQPALKPTSSTWLYYCKGPEANCQLSSGVSSTEPFFESGTNDCKFCHGGAIFAKLP